MGNNKGALIALASIPFIMTLGNSMLIPILPQISQELRISSFQASMLITVYGIVAILLIPVAGYLSDRLGRKAVIVPSLILAGAGGAVCGAAVWFGSGKLVYWIILAGRLIQGIGAAGAFPIVIPFVGDLFKDDKEVSKGLGIIETSNTFGKVISPILGAALGMVLWYLPFISIPVLCLISLLLVLFLVKKPKKAKEEPKSLREVLHAVGGILKKEGRWLYAIFAIGGICMFLLFGVLSYLSEQLEVKHHLHGVVKGLVLAIPLAVLCLASYITGKKIGKNKTVMKWSGVSGMVLSTVSLFGIGLFNNIYFVIGCLIICGSGIGVVLPCTDSLITEGIDQEIRGTVTSLYNSMRFIGVSFGPPAVSLLVNTSHRVMFFVIAGISLVAFVLILFAVRPKPEKKEGGGQIPRPAPSG
ncbi:MFS transporter [Paenibacillus yonginensis]|uniref:MFS transporter n=1 Tax=Paenibacillus yonginensis TaxID=1462996 RepID=A0A1B1MXN5_9BACL|nr:MFS transporter [Paenibacillus yonginensis]ANS73934.1 MFS transporter [Paenibacillus yonginensis]